MQTNFSSTLARLDGDAGLDGSSLQRAPSAAKKTAPRPVIQPAEIVNMLTKAPPTPEVQTVAPIDDAHDTALRGLRVGAMLSKSRTERGKFALEMCRIRATLKAYTGQELFPQERADAYMHFVGQCVFSPMEGGPGGDLTAEALLERNYAAILGNVGAPSISDSESEDDEDKDEIEGQNKDEDENEDEEEDEDEMDVNENGN